MKSVSFLTPTTLEEVFEGLQKQGSSKIVAGGTDLIVAENLKTIEYPDNLISLAKVQGLKGISWDNKRIRIGSLTSYTEIIKSALIEDKLPNLWQACYEMGTPAIRNMGTLGGNIGNASPAADAVVALMGSDAAIKTVSKTNSKEIKIKDVFLGPGKTIIGKGDVITDIVIPVDDEINYRVFRRVMPSKGSSTALVNMAIEAEFKNKVFKKIRIALGAVSTSPVRLYNVEKELIGKTVGEEVVEEALNSIEKDINPIDDGRASAWYRKQLSENIIKEALINY